MTLKTIRLSVPLFLALQWTVALAPVSAGSTSLGLVTGAVNATMDGHELLAHTALFDGDTLAVNNPGTAIVALSDGGRLIFGRGSVASFQEGGQLTPSVCLASGSVSLYQPQGAASLRISSGEVTVVTSEKFRTVGEVYLGDGTEVVRAKDGVLRIEAMGSSLEVKKGRTAVVTTRKLAQNPIPGTGAHGANVGIHMSAQTGLALVTVAEGAAATVGTTVALVRAGDAKDAANAAATASNSAVAAANSAVAAAEQAEATAVAAGCALNLFPGISPSPFTPPPGFTCPP